jgi:hypothetical protein
MERTGAQRKRDSAQHQEFGSFNYRLIADLNQPPLDGCALSGLRLRPRLREPRLLRDIFLIAQPPALTGAVAQRSF